ncbi:MAG: sigma-70 family RNA polymerase sigma factor [Clostridia bacterium]|nr:sigma-70 family RNA polymerase sigma factor [Clostridia bacterium]
MSENKEFYVTIQGKKVAVTEEVYRAYVRPIRTEQRRERRAWKCQVLGEKGNLVRCKEKCSECEYANDGNKATGNILSLDKLLEKGVEIADKHLTPEEMYIEKESRTSLQEQVHKAISQLTPRQQEIVRLVYFEGKTQEEVALLYGVDGSAIRRAMQRIYASLKRFLEKN